MPSAKIDGDLKVQRLISLTPGTGIIGALKADSSVTTLLTYDLVQGNVNHLAPAGSAVGGGTRLHTFDRPLSVTGDVTLASGAFVAGRSVTTDRVLQGYVTGDTASRLIIDAAGKISVGPGNAALDTFLQRLSAGTWQLQNAVVVGTDPGGTASLRVGGDATISGSTFQQGVQYGRTHSSTRWSQSLAAYSSDVPSVAGAIVIKTSIPSTTNRMTTVRISTYVYANPTRRGDIIVSFYRYGTGSQFINAGFSNVTAYRPTVRLAISPDGFVVIILDDVATQHSYLKVQVDDVMLGYTAVTDSYLANWSIAKVTDLTDYTELTSNLPDSSQLGNMIVDANGVPQPTSTGVLDLGVAARRWATIYGTALSLTGNATVSGSVIVGTDPGGTNLLRVGGAARVSGSLDVGNLHGLTIAGEAGQFGGNQSAGLVSLSIFNQSNTAQSAAGLQLIFRNGSGTSLVGTELSFAVTSGGVGAETGDMKLKVVHLGALNTRLLVNATNVILYASNGTTSNMTITEAGAVTFRNTVSGITTLTATTLAGTTLTVSGAGTHQIGGQTNGNNVLSVGPTAAANAPTAQRESSLYINVPSNASFLGAAWTRYRRNLINTWSTGIDSTTSSGAKSSADDYTWYNGSAYVAALSQAGQLALSGGLIVGTDPGSTALLRVGGSVAATGLYGASAAVLGAKKADNTLVNLLKYDETLDQVLFVRSFGGWYHTQAPNDGTTDARPQLAADVTALAARGVLALPPGTYRVNSALTISVPLTWLPGAMLKPAAGITITITAPVQGPATKWIDTSLGGKVVFTPRSGVQLNPRWWGAVGDFSHDTNTGTDDSAAFQAMMSATSGNVSHGWYFDLGVGSYLLTAGFVAAVHKAFITGRGAHATQFVFNPAADGAVCITMNKGASAELFEGGVRGVGFHGFPGNTRQKIALELVDTSDVHVDDIKVHNSWTSTGRTAAAPSIGLRFKGREALRTRNVSIAADRPVHLTSNPNHAYDVDVVSFHDTYLLIGEATESAILIDSGTYVQNLVFTGSSICTGGKDGVLFNNTAGQSVASRSILIENLRHESTVSPGGSLVRIVHDASMGLSVVLRNLQPSFDQNIYLRGCNNVALEHFTFSGVTGKTPIDIANCDYVSFKNVSVQAGNTVTIGADMRLVYAVGERSSLAHEPEALYVKTATLAHTRFSGNSPDLVAATAGIEIENTSGRRFLIVSGVSGVGNDGFTIYDITNGRKLCWFDNFDTFHTRGIWVEIEGVGGSFIAKSPDGTRYKLSPPNGGGAATWVLA